jgi:hypothetical protein
MHAVCDHAYAVEGHIGLAVRIFSRIILLEETNTKDP